MLSWIVFIAGLVVGAVGAWLAAQAKNKGIVVELRSQLSQLQGSLQAKDQSLNSLQQEVRQAGEQKVAAQTELTQVRLRLEEERKLFQEAERSLSNTFDALAHKALNSNNQAFLDLAKGAFETIQTQAKGDLETRQKAIDGLVAPLKDSLGRYEKQIQEMEKNRLAAYVSLDGQISSLQKVTGSLDIALRGSHTKVRGRWGELTLHRVAEMSGMSEHCDFAEQESFRAESGKAQRPDMIVNLPGGRRIAVDAKAPLQAFLEAASATTEEERKACMARQSQRLRTHMTQLGAGSY